ncbi:MAG: molybdenum cofactor biosynthesis protein MoaE [Phycisphaerales bacterium]|nr:molybdenum cofactor biosynthesis protein MoaE [Phycisphaerales bacterium]
MSVLIRISSGPLSSERLPHVLNPAPAASLQAPARKSQSNSSSDHAENISAPAMQQVGATVVFEGVVRANEAGRLIRALSYEAYEPMATNSLTELARDILCKHALIAITVEHSRGEVAAGERSFRLAIDCAHRKEALAAMDEFIDRMKRDVPIWKSPIYI